MIRSGHRGESGCWKRERVIRVGAKEGRRDGGEEAEMCFACVLVVPQGWSRPLVTGVSSVSSNGRVRFQIRNGDSAVRGQKINIYKYLFCYCMKYIDMVTFSKTVISEKLNFLPFKSSNAK